MADASSASAELNGKGSELPLLPLQRRELTAMELVACRPENEKEVLTRSDCGAKIDWPIHAIETGGDMVREMLSSAGVHLLQ